MSTAAVAESTAAVAEGLVEFCRTGKFLEAIDRYYASDIESIEPAGNEAMPAVMRGKDTVRGKNEWWLANHEVHRAEAVGPLVGTGAAADRFAVNYTFEVTNKPSGRRFAMTEVALYTVKDGKIVREQFFYHAG